MDWKYGVNWDSFPLRQILVIVLKDFNGNVTGIILFYIMLMPEEVL